MPFIPPSEANFLYDPFAFDFNNPFNQDDDQAKLLDLEGSLKMKHAGSLSFENMIKCLKDMSYSALFSQEDAKKFYFPKISEQLEEQGID